MQEVEGEPPGKEKSVNLRVQTYPVHPGFKGTTLRMNWTIMNVAVAQGTANSRKTHRLGLVAPGSRWLIFPSTNSRATSSVSDSIFSEIRKSRARTGPKITIRPGLRSSDTPSADALPG